MTVGQKTKWACSTTLSSPHGSVNCQHELIRVYPINTNQLPCSE